MTITIKAHMKINLGLHVLGRRTDGYHNLLTLMQPLNLTDIITITDETNNFVFSCNHPNIKLDNLVKKAATAYFLAINKKPNVKLHLTKRIPIAAGLGGGSSDAAATLLGLNILNKLALTPEKILQLGHTLGADVAFCLGGVTALASSIGEYLYPYPNFPLFNYVLINPKVPIVTPLVYSYLDSIWTKKSKKNNVNKIFNYKNFWNNFLINDLEKITTKFYPQLTIIKYILLNAGACYAQMSGSGPTIFGIFKNKKTAQIAANRISKEYTWWTKVCNGIIL